MINALFTVTYANVENLSQCFQIQRQLTIAHCMRRMMINRAALRINVLFTVTVALIIALMPRMMMLMINAGSMFYSMSLWQLPAWHVSLLHFTLNLFQHCWMISMMIYGAVWGCSIHCHCGSYRRGTCQSQLRRRSFYFAKCHFTFLSNS